MHRRIWGTQSLAESLTFKWAFILFFNHSARGFDLNKKKKSTYHQIFPLAVIEAAVGFVFFVVF